MSDDRPTRSELDGAVDVLVRYGKHGGTRPDPPAPAQTPTPAAPAKTSDSSAPAPK